MIQISESKRRVRYYSLLDGVGYGSSAFAYMQSLVENGIDVIWSPLVSTRYGLAPWRMLPDSMRLSLYGVSVRQDQFAATISNEKNYDTVIVHAMPELFPKLVEQGKRNIGYTVWETDQLPDHWPGLVPSVDHLMVPCVYNQSLFQLDNGPEVSVIPHINEYEGLHSSNEGRKSFRRQHDISDSTYVFYTINTWSPRKAMLETIHAYLQAFSADDDVCFVIKTNKTGMNCSFEKLNESHTTCNMVDDIVSEYPNAADVRLIDEHLKDEEILNLHNGADCYFSLTRSEGWGLGAYNAAALGNPIIITGWGGQLDYLPADFAYLVDYELHSVIEILTWESYSAKQKWAHANVDHAVSLLKEVVSQPSIAAEKGRLLADHIGDAFSKKKITEQFIDVIYGTNS